MPSRGASPLLDEAKMKSQAVIKPKRRCVLRSVVVGSRRLVVTESLWDVLGREPAPGDPVTITIKEAQRLSSLSRATIGRMLADGSAEQSNAA
jgi:hypothetical protein